MEYLVECWPDLALLLLVGGGLLWKLSAWHSDTERLSEWASEVENCVCARLTNQYIQPVTRESGLVG